MCDCCRDLYSPDFTGLSLEYELHQDEENAENVKLFNVQTAGRAFPWKYQLLRIYRIEILT